jgi:hypothetical protein
VRSVLWARVYASEAYGWVSGWPKWEGRLKSRERDASLPAFERRKLVLAFTALEMDVQMTDINSPAASTSSTPFPTLKPFYPTPWSLPPVPPRLMSTDPLFIGHTFRFKAAKFQVVEREVIKKGALWIWAEGVQVLHFSVAKKRRAD